MEGNPHFRKQQFPCSYLQPFPARTRCPAVGVSERKLNRRRAVKCNVSAMPNQHGLCQDQLGTAAGQPKICYNPEQRKGRQQQQKNFNGIKARVHNLPAFVNHAAARNSCWVKSAHGNQSDLSVKLPSGVSSGTDGVSPLPSDVGMPRQAWKEVAHTLQGAASRGQIFLIFHHSLGISINKG